MRERVVNGRDNIVRRGDFRRIGAGVYCIWKETKKWDSLAFRVRPVRTRMKCLTNRNSKTERLDCFSPRLRRSVGVYDPVR